MQVLSSQSQFEAPHNQAPSFPGREVYLLPVSFAQQRLWFVSRLQPQSSAYNLFGAFLLRGQLDIDILRRSLDEIVRRHEVLRTTFSLFDGQPMQVVTPDQAASLVVVDFRGQAEEPRDLEMKRLLGTEAQRPFDLKQDSLFRAVLFQIAAEKHLFLYVTHHIIMDGWSEAILVRELMTLYRAYGSGRPSPLPELAIQYGDFAQWQRDWLQHEVLDDLLAYWKKQLAGVPMVLELPADRPRPVVFTYRGATESFLIPREIAYALRELGQNQRVTLFMLLITAFGVFLSRHSGQEDIVIGTPVANRSQVDLEDLIGLFVNTLALRIQLPGNLTLRDVLVRVPETIYAAQEHQDLPFERLVTELKLERNPSFNPLFQAVLAFDNTPRERVELGGQVTLQPVRSGEAMTAKFDLTLAFVENGHELSGTLEYSADLFDRTTAQRMTARFQVLLASLAESLDHLVAELPLLSVAERQALLFENSGLAAPSGSAISLHERFSIQARKTPRAIAVSCEENSLTYEDLDRLSDALAQRLTVRVAGGQKRVGLCLERSLHIPIAILGTLKAGAAYVPLDPAYPRERLDYLLRDSGVTVLITVRQLLDSLPLHDCEVELVDELAVSRADSAPAQEIPGVAPESLAYVIYTSGSTGDPKGVEISHKNVIRLFEATRERMEFGENDVWTLFHSYAFDFSVWEMWGAWLHGGRLVVVPYWISRSPEHFWRLLQKERVTVLNQIPSAFYSLLQAALAGSSSGRDLLSLRYVIFGGEALEPRKLAPWFDRFGAEWPRLINMYGITETTIHVTHRPVTRRDLAGTTSPIGVSIPDLRVHVLDRFGQLAPLGVPGELCVGGAGLATGYLGRPAPTASRFVPDPFAGEPGSRLYRSGDLARWVPNQELEYLGRIDHQVKVRGFRIEPGEIEAVLAQAAEIAEAVVAVRERAGERFIAAYLVPKPGAKVRIEELRAFLQERLPEHMIPAAFLLLDVLPHTPSGKLDRNALPSPDTARPELEVGYIAPRDNVEEALAAAWSAVLGVEEIGIYDNFFSLGGDSIRSIGALAQIRERGLELSLQQFFQYPTIAELAGQVRTSPRQETSSTNQVIPFSLISDEDRKLLPNDVEDAYPLTSLQAGMLFHREQTPDAPIFHNLNSWHLRLPFDRNAFEKSLLHLAERHPILRTSFDLTSCSEPLQLVHRQAVFPVAVEDLRGLPETEQVQVIADYKQKELRNPFEFSACPQIRFHVHLRGDDAVQFTLTENHAILDGWSLHTLFDDLLRFYFAFLRGEPAPALPTLQTRFRDFVALEREALSSPDFVEFWDRRLSGGAVLKMPRWPRPPLRLDEQRLRSILAVIPKNISEALESLARTESVPLKSIYLAAHLKVLSFVSGQTDLLTGLSSNGRLERVDGHRVCGLFLNTLPLRQALPGGSWREMVRQTHENEKEMLPYRRYPLGAIQERWGRESLLETSFVYLNFHVVEDVLRSEGLQQIEMPEMVEQTNFAVMTAFQHSFLDPSIINLSINCDRAVLDDPQIDALAEYYLAVLRAMALDPSARYDSFCPLSEAERTMILGQWSDAPFTSSPHAGLAHERFEGRAEQTPDLVCLSTARANLSFAEVNRRANHLAHYLRQMGIGPESQVAVCLERSPQLVVAILGVLKAGGAYVPLDPTSPPERLRAILEDARAAVVLTVERWREPLCGSAPLILLDMELDALGGERDENPSRVATACTLAYVIYTSGSTGIPKGVAVEHRQLAAYLNAVEERLALQTGASYAWISTPAADLGHTMLFPPLVLGATLHVLSESSVRDPHLLSKALDRSPVDYLKIVPSQLSALLECPEAERFLPSRRLILGGEAADWTLIKRLRELVPDQCSIFNHYGPTETTVGVLVHSLDDESPAHSSIPPLGRPMAGTRAYLLDRHLQPRPAGAAGELFIGGCQVARGYIGRPDQTAERFVPDPFSSEPGTRLYRTGDLARHLPDGRQEFLGRIDNQIKIRGFRVELGEIESVLKQHLAIRDAVLLAQGEADEKKLVAYIVPHSGTELDLEELRRQVASALPSYMQPAAFVRLAALPLTPNGKLDRKALPHSGEIAEERQETAHPRDPLELQLAQIWEELLGTQSIGIRDDFFASGGNSLLAVRLVAQIRRQLGHRLPLTALLETPTIELLAAVLRTEMPPPVDRHLVAVQPRGTHLPLFLVHPGHGGVSSYLDLARYLGGDQPLYGLQARDLDREGDVYMSVEELASRYLAEVRTKQEHGPYLLGGWSFGGLVAFEMAQQLRRAGEEVGALLLLDTRTPAVNTPLASLEPSLMKAYLLVEHAKQIAHVSARDLTLSPHDLVDLELAEQLDRLMSSMNVGDTLPKDIDPALVRRYLELRVARFLAIKNYQAEPYQGTITLFRATEVYTDTSLAEVARIFEEISRHPTYRWDELTTEPVTVYHVPGDHESMIYEPHVKVLARSVAGYLDGWRLSRLATAHTSEVH